MASVTSYCNPTLWRKTMLRFWPLWTAYGVFWLFAIPLNLINSYANRLNDYYEAAKPLGEWMLGQCMEVPYLLESGVLLALTYGVLSAMAVFGYLYNNRSACMTHALPMRRETLFVTNYLAGVSFFLLPQVVVGVIAVAVEMIVLPGASWLEGMSALGIWFLCQSAVSLFFFSFAAFCAMFTGHILALPVFYGILNGLVIGLYTIITELMRELFYGYVSRFDELFVTLFTPVCALAEAADWRAIYSEFPDPVTGDYVRLGWQLEDPGRVALYAVAALVFAAAALAVYRRRHIESAGDVVSVPVVRPIFKAGLSFCVGLCFGTVTALFFSWMDEIPLLTACMVAWGAVGWFAAEMLLKKSFRVWKAWKGCLVWCAVLAAVCSAFFLDCFGIETKVPRANQVEHLVISTNLGAPWDGGEMLNLTLEDEEDIQWFIDLHQAIVDDRGRAEVSGGNYPSADDHARITLNYTLKDGSILRRSYRAIPVFMDEAEQEGTVTWLFNQLLADKELVAKAYGLDSIKGKLVAARLQNVLDTTDMVSDTIYVDGSGAQDLDGLWDAVMSDFAAGRIGVRYLFGSSEERYAHTFETDLRFTFETTYTERGPDGKLTQHTGSQYLYITLTPDAKETLAWLERHDALGTRYQLIAHEDYWKDMDDPQKYLELYGFEETVAVYSAG